MEKEKTLNGKKAWEALIQQLKLTTDGQTFSTLISSTQFLSHEDNTFTIGVPNSFARNWLEERLTDTVIKLLAALMDEPQKVKFVTGEAAKPKPAITETTVAEQPRTETVPVPVVTERNAIHPRYTFDSFVVGSNNNLACAAGKAVAAMPSVAYNPLFIHSAVGLGKTHLLYAIGNRIHELFPEKNVLYVSSEEFTNDFINSIQRHENAAFREKYRRADVLLIDDIQFIIGKESTQEEFFHTFNTLYKMDKQIVITSDRAPKEITTLDERMRSRFEWGLTVDIQAPDLETRIAILADKAKRHNREIPADVLEMIAKNFTENVRVLEGALNRVIAVSDLCGMRIDRNMAQMALSDILATKTEVKPADIIIEASKVFGVPSEKIISRDRTRNVALARQVVMYLLREECNYSLPQIGMALGGRDHSTVIHGIEKVSNCLENDIRFRRKVATLRNQVFGSSTPMMAYNA